MPRPRREGAEKYSFRLSKALMARLAEIAQQEGRTTTAQMERWLAEKIREYEAKAEKNAGNRAPQLKAA